MFVSLIIPVHNGRDTLPQCLAAVNQTLYDAWECVVVDDGSTDGSGALARQMGMRVITNDSGLPGPAQARNLGAAAAEGDVLFFIDADVLVQPGTVGIVAATLSAYPDLAACFGSYDDSPTETNFLSQYRNLLHHFTHQQARSEASTFWSGCGAIYRHVFNEIGGFAVSAFPRPSIEDIELGYRLRAAGYQIRLEKLLQVSHMKRWSARQMVVTDVRDRAIPWSRLILQDGSLPNDLNLQTGQRVSTAVAFLGLVAPGGALVTSWLWLLWGTAVAVLVWLNRHFYRFLLQKRGIWFLLRALPWHWFYFIYSGAAFAAVFILARLGKLEQRSLPQPRPLSGFRPPPPRSAKS